ncbi:hypothetical protein WYY_19259 [Bacillus velezensis M27]|uniref:DUF3139 domain-containing protein n=1 Tax=Bacillus velezensis TaxID=492670 RepID=UPI000286933A|nr:DUF3139 domain-containing protein [Bacillus velezensis]ASF57322.1 hypothetical protein CEG11_19520 [Bacillus velezensis]EKE45897.1 hypothetical protein WYY_19259 [Bacillus velezensis M27]
MRKKYVILTIFLIAILGIVGGFVKNHYDKKRLEDDVYTYLEDHNVSKNEVSSLNKVYDKGRKPPEKNQIRVSLKRDSDVDYYFYRNKSGKIVLDYATKNGEEVDLKDVPL